jgi:hypothetical protein
MNRPGGSGIGTGIEVGSPDPTWPRMWDRKWCGRLREKGTIPVPLFPRTPFTPVRSQFAAKSGPDRANPTAAVSRTEGSVGTDDKQPQVKVTQEPPRRTLCTYIRVISRQLTNNRTARSAGSPSTYTCARTCA